MPTSGVFAHLRLERSLSAALTSADVCQIPLTVKREQSGCEPDNIPDVQTQT